MNSSYIVIPLVLTLWATESSAQVSQWESKNAAGVQAFQQRSYADAENFFTSALQQAEQFGDRDSRFATSLNNLASLRQAQNKYAEAEPLYRRALGIWETIYGPENMDVASALNNLATLLQDQARDSS